MSRRRCRGLAALLLLAALTGCVGLPDSGEVHAGVVEQGDGQDGDLEYIAELPEPGASQQEIVLGFMQAAITSTDDFAIAREYLTGAFASQWDPYASVQVRTGQPVVAETGDDLLDVTVDVAGLLDAHGIYVAADDTARLTFELVADDGEWRIVDGPDGIVLTAYYFERLFETHALSWLSQDRTWAVPDTRWLPVGDEGKPERIVDAVLAGPADWLAPSVWTAAAEDVQRVGAVQIDGGTANVVVSDTQAAGSDEAGMAILAQQLQLALLDADIEVDEVVVASGDAQATSTDAPPLATSSLDPRPVVLVQDVLMALGSGASVDFPAGPALAAAGATDAIALDDGSLTAALADDEVLRIAGDGTPTVLADDVSVPPSLDRFGWIWWVDAAGSLHASDGTREADLGAVSSARVVALEVSRDGARVAVLTTDAEASHVQVTGIVRADDGEPSALTAGVATPDIAGLAIDVTWTGPDTIAVLSDVDDGSSIVHIEVGGESMQLPDPPEPIVQLVGGDEALSSLRARAEDGTVLALRGGAWQPGTDQPSVELILTRV